MLTTTDCCGPWRAGEGGVRHDQGADFGTIPSHPPGFGCGAHEMRGQRLPGPLGPQRRGVGLDVHNGGQGGSVLDPAHPRDAPALRARLTGRTSSSV
ncbi:hypothetical protein [Streptomyces sp. NPDC046978]|uniref:hypothetical protein n=1 Tax=Streptomyces sp. NPDC046978 TaxID=3154704 RepID=UPI0033C387FA